MKNHLADPRTPPTSARRPHRPFATIQTLSLTLGTLALLAPACVPAEEAGEESAEAAACTDPSVSPADILPERSLAISDPAVLGDGLSGPFRLDVVLRQLVRQANPALTDVTAGPVAVELNEQWWSTFAVANGDTARPHCDSPDPRALPGVLGPSFNGFLWQCPRAEASNATAPLSSWTPTALFYRPDLMPTDARNCGEARIVYARNASTMVIFEAKIPNPTPGCVEGCRQVARYWANFSTELVNGQRLGAPVLRDRLQRFYFLGTAIPGLGPVIHINNLAGSSGGAYAGSSGQVRTNVISNGPWELKEFAVRRIAGTNPRRIELRPQTDKVNPSPLLFADLPTGNDPTSVELRNRITTFRQQFIAQDVERLAFGDVNSFTMAPADTANSGQSRSGGGEPSNPSTDYRGAGVQIRALIDAQLNTLRSRPTRPLTNLSIDTNVILARATAMSCSGCHFNAINAPIGNNPSGQPEFWPAAAGFVHVTNTTSGRDISGGTSGFRLSSALNQVFLPARQAVLANFLNRSRCTTCPSPSPSPSSSPAAVATTGGRLSAASASPAPSATPAPSASPGPLDGPHPWSETIGGRTVH